MTTYILAGGNDRRYESYGHDLASVVLLWVPEPKVVSCFFSKDESEWEQSTINWRAWFKQYFGQSIEYHVASPDSLLEDIAWADVVYFHGGNTLKLTTAMKVYADVEESFEGKIIIGSSAGSNFLSGTYYSPSRDVIEKGSGIVDFAVIAHYGAAGDGDVLLDHAGWQDIINRTKSASPGEQILLITEGTFVVIVK